ncbi:30S ribosomal protein S20 [Tuwongella immobilis]|uniref:Small ribosomal subunit protein bS20 n=1 Tax=Tuwongella immobilis TaxID=692036 RepID=A0A6C2YRB6_9BACT|nr:30S ribosomal protein S20 [Tuwongella immobilis]VIP03653.1 30s ribosomal protein s20 : 30S ribosomal protein S20 OS=Pirellula staleyi (strain ATCC 27377 / DSM 6068 / ICPB 4128) GN=rpsT PE=3 SV=1: Ribosomal_S20p [Tuwongella immobilis]VTS04674.1 30s ribosomal protein s20 : 30S ribosomal protein S20 OS=Pirellula staleyi (strain ATCC 27377 / DSM 6068 / ICPB 4128) GN=rpsT PE=3 SV=1: Ribosomal_S20p [Tuwongella immobilis]
MPHTRSSKKALRKNIKRRDHNREIKKELKLQVKAFLAALKTGTAEQAQQEFNKVAKKLDKAGARRTLHPNTASRKKGRLAIRLAAKLNPPAAPAN